VLDVSLTLRVGPAQTDGGRTFTVSAVEGPELEPRREELAASLKSRPPTGAIAVSPAGKLERLRFELHPAWGENDLERELGETLKSLFSSLSMALDGAGALMPRTAVSRGARWQSPARTAYHEAVLEGRSEMELAELDDAQARIRFRSSMKGNPDREALFIPSSVLVEQLHVELAETGALTLRRADQKISKLELDARLTTSLRARELGQLVELELTSRFACSTRP
jgi:hypothetical protein